MLKEKAEMLEGYVIPFDMQDNIVKKIIEDNSEILEHSGIYKKFSI